jgi:hypothetical protein
MPASAGSFEFVVMVEAPECISGHAARWTFGAKDNPSPRKGQVFLDFLRHLKTWLLDLDSNQGPAD